MKRDVTVPVWLIVAALALGSFGWGGGGNANASPTTSATTVKLDPTSPESVQVSGDSTGLTHVRSVSSNLVTLEADVAGGYFSRLLSDGSRDPGTGPQGYSPPAGMDLVILDMQWSTSSLGGYDLYQFPLLRYAPNGSIAQEAAILAPITYFGNAGGSLQFAGGIVVASEGHLRVGAAWATSASGPFENVDPTMVILHGYLVPHR